MKALGSIIVFGLGTGCLVKSTGSTMGPGPRPGPEPVGSPSPSETAVVGPDANGNITMPDLFGMTKDQAVATLARAGHQGNIYWSDQLCTDDVMRGTVMEIGMVCVQRPDAGRVQPPKLAITITVQTESPWRGNIGKVTEWRLLPKLVGLSVEQARAELKRVGYTSDGTLLVEWVDEPGCKPLTVCRVYPAEMTRVTLTARKTIYAGRDPNAKPIAPPTEAPTTPGTPTTPASPPSKPPPEPFF